MNFDFETYDSLKNYLENVSYLYIIYSEYGCKIGYSKSPLERIEQIKHGLPSQKCFFVGLYLNEKALTHEKRLHKIFKPQKIAGEWFILNDENLDFIHNYLLKNNFKCLIRKSIIWANYIVPSIYLKGKVKIVHKINHNNKNSLKIPNVFIDMFRKPEPEEIEKDIANFVTPTEISEKLSFVGYSYNSVTVGKFLKALNFERVTKRVPNKEWPIKGYYVIMNK